jgi:hypothetical protein
MVSDDNSWPTSVWYRANTRRSRADHGMPFTPTGCGIAICERVTGHDYCGDEPPTADPHGGWCGGSEPDTPRLPD